MGISDVFFLKKPTDGVDLRYEPRHDRQLFAALQNVLDNILQRILLCHADALHRAAFAAADKAAGYLRQPEQARKYVCHSHLAMTQLSVAVPYQIPVNLHGGALQLHIPHNIGGFRQIKAFCFGRPERNAVEPFHQILLH